MGGSKVFARRTVWWSLNWRRIGFSVEFSRVAGGRVVARVYAGPASVLVEPT